jgi:dTMP kinase
MKIYFTASTSYNGELIPYYRKIFNHIKKHKVRILSGYQVINKTTLDEDKELTATDIYNREKRLINQADLIIAEVSKPSLGVGAEIVYALNEGKKVLALVRTDYEDRISPILLGNPSENLYLEFYCKQDYPRTIDKFIRHMFILMKHTKILKKKSGKFIVIDGADGSGKTTQVSILQKYLKRKHTLTKIFDFPQYYTSFHGRTVARFLRGEFGTIDNVSPYLSSLAYALDRVSAKKEMDEFLSKGGTIIANRYVTSNMAHQAAKFKTLNEQKKFLNWLIELEYVVHNMPRENIIIYLYVPWRIGMQLTAKKDKRPYLKGKIFDIHEEDIKYRQNVEKLYLRLCRTHQHWVKIDCIENDSILSPQKIHQKILTVLKQKKLLQ